MIRKAVPWAVCALLASSAFAEDVSMVRLAGTPEEIGRTWGEINRQVIARHLNDDYLQKAAAEGISQETLIERSRVFVRIVREIAPHWLDEARAIARCVPICSPARGFRFPPGRRRSRS